MARAIPPVPAMMHAGSHREPGGAAARTRSCITAARDLCRAVQRYREITHGVITSFHKPGTRTGPYLIPSKPCRLEQAAGTGLLDE